MNKVCWLILLGFQAGICLGQPDWVENRGASYNGGQYLAGFGIATIDKNSDLEEVRQRSLNNARRDLTERVKLSISSMQRTSGQYEVSGVDGKTGTNYSEVFESSLESFSQLEVTGLNRLEHQDRKFHYHLVYILKRPLHQQYQRNWEAVNQDINDTYRKGLSLINQNKFEARKTLLSCFKKIDQRNELESVIYAIGYDTVWDDDVITYQTVKDALKEIQQTTIKTVKDLSFLIATNLISQEREAPGMVIVKPLVHREMGLPSSFSRYLRDQLEADLAANSDWSVTAATRFTPGQQYSLVRGHYRQIDTNVEFRVFLQDPTSGIRASYQVSVPLEVLQNSNLSHVPKATDQLKNVEGLEPSGLKVDVWTNRGKEDLLFVEDEILRLGFKVNMPCYLRVVYYLADGSKVLFFDNYQVVAEEVKNDIIYPDEFVCAPPFGVENLLVYAKTTPFDPLITRSQGGYTFIIDQTANIVLKSRDMRGFKNSDYLAESRLTITTMAKYD